ncbi:hypothetical protein BU25DRAFT_26935 [Macroventuria anomochaeta]|uniref:Uncharacterized protein n=1 Tax=Macroventuria anomochaeta TaxID=301207 RepID=A0ACB6S6W1_9PLEO|nr:uncharacterized protein BU25DRAFT_26935 [Macroventuria anomochaeta]KAF2629108.1 hypothetical protein BU25DRAFT_26935 [Macroventuria anomochaeta]
MSTCVRTPSPRGPRKSNPSPVRERPSGFEAVLLALKSLSLLSTMLPCSRHLLLHPCACKDPGKKPHLMVNLHAHKPRASRGDIFKSQKETCDSVLYTVETSIQRSYSDQLIASSLEIAINHNHAGLSLLMYSQGFNQRTVRQRARAPCRVQSIEATCRSCTRLRHVAQRQV